MVLTAFYSADPKLDANAVKFDEISYADVLTKEFKSNGSNSYYFM